MPKIVAEIRGLRRTVGGQPHSGWLPTGVAVPLPTPMREIALDLRIEELAPGSYLLISDDGENVFDSFFEELGDAVVAAQESYGVRPSDWHPPLDHLPDRTPTP